MMAKGRIPDPLLVHVRVCAREGEHKKEKEERKTDDQHALIKLMTFFSLRQCGYYMSKSEREGLTLPAMGHVCLCSCTFM